MPLDPVRQFLVAPDVGYDLLARRDPTGQLAAWKPAWQQLAQIQGWEGTEPVEAPGLLTTVPALGRNALASGRVNGIAEALAGLLSSAADPAWEALVGEGVDDLAVANPVERIMPYVEMGNLQRLPAP